MDRTILLGAVVGLTVVPLPDRSQPDLAATVSITFEAAEDPRAVGGAAATNLYVARGVRFPSRPTIERDGANHVLQQGRGGGRPDPLPDRVTCAPLVMEFSAAMGVRQARLRVINRHLRSYSVQAFAAAAEVDADVFTTSPAAGPPYPPLRPFRDITLRAESGEGDITRVVATPPSDCFDLMVIDNLVLETARGVAPIAPVPDAPLPNRISVLAYEVTQGVMSRLTRPAGTGETPPDTRLMALPERRLRFVEGRNTAVRFFLGASETTDSTFDARLRVTAFYADGSTRTKTITENTDGGRSAPAPAGADAGAMRRALVLRRARVDQSHDYVIPGRFLENARSVRLQLSALSTGASLAAVRVDFDGPFRMGVNVARVNGVGLDLVVGPAPSRVTTSLAAQFLADIYPVTGFITLRESGVLTMNSGQTANCTAFLAALDAATAGTTAAAPIPGVTWWTNVYLTTRPPGCGGLGWYNTPGALTNAALSTVAHEVGHNLGINHTTSLHGESVGGTRGDWETWPYTHGSIGAVDEGSGFDDGVFGVVLEPNAASLALDMIDNWGVWTIGPVAPCISAAAATVFPTCTAPDASLTHEYMSYGPVTPVPIWGAQNWISDVNYHRAIQFFRTCIALDPPNRFQAGQTNAFTDTTGECNGAGVTVTVAGGAAGAAPQEALVFSGVIGVDGAIGSFRVIRKLAAAESFANPPGPYVLIMRRADGSVIKSIPFAERLAPAEGAALRSFAVVAPYDARLAKVEVLRDGATVFSRERAGPAPIIALVSPTGGEVWRSGRQRIEWTLAKAGTQTEVYVQYSPDKGSSWVPLGLIGGGQTSLQVDVGDLAPSNDALVYVSAAEGINTDRAIIPRTFAVGPNAVAPEPRPEPRPTPLDFKEDCLAHDPSAITLTQISGRWKIVQGQRWMFDFGSEADEAKAAFAVLQRFGFDATCYIGRPGPAMTYLKKAGVVPGGASQGLDCLGFDAASVQVRAEGGQWLLYSKTSRMAVFPSEAEAREALSVISAYGLNRHCFVGRPDPSFEYWLSSP